MIARGQVRKNGSGGIALQVEASQTFAILPNDLSSQLETMADSNSYVTIRGLIYQKQKGQKKQTLPSSLTVTIVEIQQKE